MTQVAGVAVGDVLYLNSSGSLAKADANAATTCSAVGIAVEAGSGAKLVMAACGQPAMVSFDTAPGVGDVGKAVYVSVSSAGTATVTAPSAAGDTVYRVGYLMSSTAASGLYKILFQPQFLVEIN